MITAPKDSNVSQTFSKIKGNGNIIKCKLCQKFCGNTSNLTANVKNIHKAVFLERNKENSQVMSKIGLPDIHSETITKGIKTKDLNISMIMSFQV